MNKFRELGFIDYDGSGLRIHQLIGECRLHEQPQIRT